MSLAHITSLPDVATIAKASALNVLDATGKNVSFGSIFEEHQTVVIFIRALTSFLKMYHLLALMGN
jgi:hypothetical protein